MKGSILSIVLSLAVVSCGGGSSSSSGQVSGVAATGAAIQGTVQLTDAGNTRRSAATPGGSFSFDTTGLTPPFLLKADWSGGELYSFAAGPGTANITPLTHAIVLSAAGGASLPALFAAPDPAALAALAGRMPDAKAKLVAGLDPLLSQYAPGLDPVTGVFRPDGTGLDQFLDAVSVSFDAGSVTLDARSTGAMLFSAPSADLGQGLSSENWSSADGQAAQDPCVAVDPSGQGLALWSGSDGTRYHIESRWLCGGRPPATISNDLGDAAFPRVAFDGAGEATAVWVQYGGGRNTVWSNQYRRATGWGVPVQVSSPAAPGDAYYPDLGVDAAGNAVAVWYEGAAVATNHFDVYSSQYSAATGAWSAPAMRSNGANSAYRPKVAASRGGAALLVWTQDLHDGSVSNDAEQIAGAAWTASGGWSAPLALNSVSGTVQPIYAQVAVAMDDSGDGMALWVQAGPSGPFYIWAAAYAGGAWQAASAISDNVADNCYAPDLAFVREGVAVGAWKQQDTRTAFAAANTFTGGAWGTSAMISDGAGEAYDPHIAVDASGNAEVIWFQIGTADVTIRANRCLAGGAWGAPQLVGLTGLTPAEAAGGLETPVSAIAANQAGRSFMVWGIDPQ